MIPFSPPHIDQLIIDEVVDTLKSGWITTGPKTKKFEQELRRYSGASSVLCVSSCTAGLELMLRWFGIGEGDEVIVPAITYCATANVILHCGAKPVMVDIGPDFNIDVNQLEAAITARTKAVIPVDIAGLPCDYDTINAIVSSDDMVKRFQSQNEIQNKLGRIVVIADSAHSLGAVYKDKKTGSLTDCSVFSFHAVKNLSTAEGGAICNNFPSPFDNQDLYKMLRIRSLHGQSRDAFSKQEAGNWEYDVLEAGYKMNMPDVLASMGLIELARYDKTLKKRREIFEQYDAIFVEHDWAERPTFEDESRTSSFHIYQLRIRDITEEQRNRAIQLIFDEGVSVNVHFKPLPMLTLYKEQGYNISDYPNAYQNYSREISLPVYFDLSHEQVNQVIESVIKAVNAVK